MFFSFQIDSLRDSTKRSSRRNGAIAPHAKGESSPSSPSYSENSSSVNSIKRSLDIDQCDQSSNKKHLNNKNTDGYVTTNNDIQPHGGSGGENVEESCGSITNNTSPSANYGCVSSISSSNSNYNKYSKQQQQHKEMHTAADSVDCAKHSKSHDIRSSDRYEGYSLSTTSSSKQQITTAVTPASSTATTKSITSKASTATTVASSAYEQNYHHSKVTLSSSSSTIKSESISSPDACFSVPTSPTSMSIPIMGGLYSVKQKDTASSVPTSPESGAQEIIMRRTHPYHYHQQQQEQLQQQNLQHQQQQQQQSNGVIRKCDASGFRTSRSEDHLQHTQRDTLGAIVPIDIDEDVNSSLNTLLDTRHDSEESQVCYLISFLISFCAHI